MSQYNILKLKLPNSQLNKIISRIKNDTEVTLKVSSNFVGHYKNDSKFWNFVKLLQINPQLI